MSLLPLPLPMEVGILDSRSSSASSSSSIASSQSLTVPCPSSLVSSSSLVRPSQRHPHRLRGAQRVFRSIFRALPMFKLPVKCRPRFNDAAAGGSVLNGGARNLSRSKITGTLFGYRKGRMSLSMQEDSMCLPSLVVDLALPTHALTKEMSTGTVRIALECEKKAEQTPRMLLEEPSWSMDGVLQWEEERAWTEEGGDGGRLGSDGAATGGVDGRRGAAGEIRHRGAVRGDGLHESQLLPRGGIKRLPDAVHVRTRGQQRP